MFSRRFQITVLLGLVAVFAESTVLTGKGQQRPATAPAPADPFAGLQFRNIIPHLFCIT